MQAVCSSPMSQQLIDLQANEKRAPGLAVDSGELADKHRKVTLLVSG